MKLLKFNYLIKFFLLGLFVTTFNACQSDEIVTNSDIVTLQEISSDKEDSYSARYTSSFLPTHENCGGHTIERHIEKSDSYLRNRLNNSNISAASTFYNFNQAGQIIYNTIYYYNSNYNRVNNWLNSSSTSYLVLYYTHYKVLGKVMNRNYSTFESKSIKVVLAKSNCSSYPFRIVTAYPY